MARVRLKNVRIAGIASVVPAGVRCIDDEIELFGGDAALIKRLKKDIGINRRHVVTNEECASDLCEAAAKLLLAEMGCDASSIDGLIMVTQTPDYFQPASSCVLHSRLALSPECASFDVNLGCSGYVYGLWIASTLIASQSSKRVLLLAGDTLSRCVSPRDRAVAPLFGDAGSATIIESASDDDEISFVLHTNGNGYKHLMIPAGAFRTRPSEETARMIEREHGNIRSEENLYMNGAEVFTFSIKDVPPLIEDTLVIAGWNRNEIDRYILHQANKFILENISRRIKVPLERVPYNTFIEYGNQSSASIPVTICDNLSDQLTTKPLKLLLAGFGVGLSWAAAAVKCGPIHCLPVTIYSAQR